MSPSRKRKKHNRASWLARCLDNETMKILNKDINNRMYTYLSACFGGDEIELEKLDKTINYLAKYYGNDWNKAEKMKILMDL